MRAMMMNIWREMKPSAIFIFIIIHQLQHTSSLRDLVLTLPHAASLGKTILISCNYHLQGEELYTIKFYKGRHEFLQIAPDKSPPVKTFHRKGINIQNVTLDGEGKNIVGVNVTLTDVNLFTTGLYGCEASADSSFHTQLVRKYLTVLVQPGDRPEVVGFKNRYRVGETVNMSCYSRNTFPSANLTWFINGDRLDKMKGLDYSKSFESTASPESGLLTSKSVLSLRIKPRHFQGGRLLGKCVASILTMHWQSLDIEIREESPQTASVLSTKSGGEEGGALSEEETDDALLGESNNRTLLNKDDDLTAEVLHHETSSARNPFLIVIMNSFIYYLFLVLLTCASHRT